MSNKLQRQACVDCLLAMEEVKGASLSRIACANCQHAQDEMNSVAKAGGREKQVVPFGFRCTTCGKFCWTRTGLGHHRLMHGPWERN